MLFLFKTDFFRTSKKNYVYTSDMTGLACERRLYTLRSIYFTSLSVRGPKKETIQANLELTFFEHLYCVD